jgi:Methyltransferase domain
MQITHRASSESDLCRPAEHGPTKEPTRLQDIPCRLCGGNCTENFRLRGPQGIDISYFECTNCGSLQTQEAGWLHEAYASTNLAITDMGAAQRVLYNHAFVLMVAKILRLRTILDFGGGDGLLCRLLRDRGLDAWTTDEYATPTYARGFEGNLARNYELITAFEVLEHLPQPRAALDGLFETGPRFIIASTEIYSGQDSSWWYLAPREGQHIFFYSRHALQVLASRHGYAYYPVHGWHLFAKQPLTQTQAWVTWCLTSSKALRLFRSTLPFSETWTWVLRDFKSRVYGYGHKWIHFFWLGLATAVT